MSGPVRHREVAFVPMCTTKRGKHWFVVGCMRRGQRDARDALCEKWGEDWKTLKKEGVLIVRVEVKA